MTSYANCGCLNCAHFKGECADCIYCTPDKDTLLNDEDHSFVSVMHGFLGEDQALDYAIGLLDKLLNSFRTFGAS